MKKILLIQKQLTRMKRRGNGWRENLLRAVQNADDVRGKQKNPRQIRQILNSTAIGGEKIAKENQYLTF